MFNLYNNLLGFSLKVLGYEQRFIGMTFNSPKSNISFCYQFASNPLPQSPHQRPEGHLDSRTAVPDLPLRQPFNAVTKRIHNEILFTGIIHELGPHMEFIWVYADKYECIQERWSGALFAQYQRTMFTFGVQLLVMKKYQSLKYCILIFLSSYHFLEGLPLTL